jgi:hypothetical protein
VALGEDVLDPLTSNLGFAPLASSLDASSGSAHARRTVQVGLLDSPLQLVLWLPTSDTPGDVMDARYPPS